VASIIIVWDTRVNLPGPGAMSGPGENNVARIKVDGTTPMDTIVAKILSSAHDDKIKVLKIFAHGGSWSGGAVALGKDRLTISTVYRFRALAGRFEEEEGRIELHSCLVAKNAGDYTSDSWTFLQALAAVSDAYVYAGEELQMVSSDKLWDPDWEGAVWIFAPNR
jgi:hypothetical protein